MPNSSFVVDRFKLDGITHTCAFTCSDGLTYLFVNGRAIPLREGGVRHGILAAIAAIHLFFTKFDSKVKDLMSYFYACLVGKLSTPTSVKNARIITDV